MEPVKIVVRYCDGRLVKGFTQNFSPTKERFHLFRTDSPSRETIEVSIRDLKAVFMVRDFTGDPLYRERGKYIDGEKSPGRKVEITFVDGEVLVGSTLGYDQKRQSFFVFPADSRSNNTRVFVVSSAVEKVRHL